MSSPNPDNDAPSAFDSADPPRNFSLTVDQRIRALTIGVPAWAARKRQIEDEVNRLVGELLALEEKLASAGTSAETIERSLMATAVRIDLRKLNELVAAHNRYYPIEANLPMDRRTGAYLIYGHVWEPEEPFTPERLVALARLRAESEG